MDALMISLLPIWVVGALATALMLWTVRPALNSRRWSMAYELSAESLLMGVLAIGFFALFFQNNLELVPVVILAIVVHEYGHVLAFRLAGHKNPKFRLIPFGGVAISNEPPRNMGESAFVSLMGPGFSVLLVAVAAVASTIFIMLGLDTAAAYAYRVVIVTGALNAFNLLPLLPLDGSKVVRSIAMSYSRPFAAGLTTGMGIAAMALLALAVIATRQWFLLIFIVIILGAMKNIGHYDGSTPKMKPRGAWVASFAYLATFLVHLYAGWHWFAAIILSFLSPVLRLLG
ncbi:MAG: hypothetical protein MRY63_10235 [Neomegalonema sp.]|nr:hypothetical protein [Neomegalonema sp.]